MKRPQQRAQPRVCVHVCARMQVTHAYKQKSVALAVGDNQHERHTDGPVCSMWLKHHRKQV